MCGGGGLNGYSCVEQRLPSPARHLKPRPERADKGELREEGEEVRADDPCAEPRADGGRGDEGHAGRGCARRGGARVEVARKEAAGARTLSGGAPVGWGARVLPVPVPPPPPPPPPPHLHDVDGISAE